MSPLLFAAGVAVAVVLALVARLAWARRGAVYVARVYDDQGRTFVIGKPMPSKRLALDSAWERAFSLGVLCRPPFDPAAEGYTDRVVKL